MKSSRAGRTVFDLEPQKTRLPVLQHLSPANSLGRSTGGAAKKGDGAKNGVDKNLLRCGESVYPDVHENHSGFCKPA